MEKVASPAGRRTRYAGLSRPGGRPVLAAVALVLVAVNLRPAVSSIGPVLAEARADLGMSATVAGLLSSLPVACFAVVGVLASRLSRRRGPEPVIAAGVAATAAGLAARPFAGGTASFLALTCVALAGIAVVNVLLPAVVKRSFPDRVGAMTGLYTTALNVGAAAAAAVTVPLTGMFGGDWRAGVGAWAVPAALAVPPWLALARRATRPAASGTPARPAATASAATAPAATASPPASGWASDRDSDRASGQAPAPPARLVRQPTAWALAVYFGLQASSAYVMIGWLPQVFRDAGLPAGTAGLLFAVTALLGVPLALPLAAAAGRLANQSAIAAGLGLAGLAGYLGLWASPATAPWLWAVLLGVANCSFPLALTMIGLRGRTGGAVVRLSGFVQSTGYLLSIPGPILVGALYQHTGGWRAPLAVVALLVLGQIAAGVVAGRNRQLG